MNDDPFAFDEDDKTVLRPRGGRAAQNHGTNSPQQYSQQAVQTGRDIPLLGGINPLEKAASRLLPLLITIKNSASHPDPTGLRNKLVTELEDFKNRARDVLKDPKQVTQASYVMCTALDEAAMNTPWGHESNWSQHNLLSTFHNEVFGGERFFTLLRGLGKKPEENIDLLELMYVCLTLGYEGSYRIAKNGQDTLAKVRNWLYDIIQKTRKAPDAALAMHWQGSEVKESKLPKMTPIWVGLAACLAIGSLAYVSLLFKLGGQSETVVAGFSQIKAEKPTARKIEPPVAPIIEDPQTQALSVLLQNEIAAGELQVDESEFDHGKILLVGDNLFGSGRSDVNSDIVPLIGSVADALNQYEGVIVVSGHSDNVPIRSAKFPSNLALSQARADSVTAILAESIANVARLRSEGRGSNEPLPGVDENTKAGRSKNRRVEITVFY